MRRRERSWTSSRSGIGEDGRRHKPGRSGTENEVKREFDKHDAIVGTAIASHAQVPRPASTLTTAVTT
jgi:hypothetical protein